MNRIQRIQKMEQYFDAASEAVNALSDALDKYQEAQKALIKLIEYLDGLMWIGDFEADEAGKLPKDLKRGVLSEDGLYDLLVKNRIVLAQMADVVSYSISKGAL